MQVFSHANIISQGVVGPNGMEFQLFHYFLAKQGTKNMKGREFRNIKEFQVNWCLFYKSNDVKNHTT